MFGKPGTLAVKVESPSLESLSAGPALERRGGCGAGESQAMELPPARWRVGTSWDMPTCLHVSARAWLLLHFYPPSVIPASILSTLKSHKEGGSGNS